MLFMCGIRAGWIGDFGVSDVGACVGGLLVGSVAARFGVAGVRIVLEDATVVVGGEDWFAPPAEPDETQRWVDAVPFGQLRVRLRQMADELVQIRARHSEAFEGWAECRAELKRAAEWQASAEAGERRWADIARIRLERTKRILAENEQLKSEIKTVKDDFARWAGQDFAALKAERDAARAALIEADNHNEHLRTSLNRAESELTKLREFRRRVDMAYQGGGA